MKQREVDIRHRIHSLVHGDDNVDLGTLRNILEEGRQTFGLVDSEAEEFLEKANLLFRQVADLTKNLEQTMETVRELQENDPNGRCPDAKKYVRRLQQDLTTWQGVKVVSARLMRCQECPTEAANKVLVG